jgi:TPR repeat protein
MFASGTGGAPRDLGKAEGLWQVSCDRGFAPACAQLAAAAISADQNSLALLYASKACIRRDPGGCTALGIQALTGRGTPEDPDRAERLFAYACSRGEGRACALSAWSRLSRRDQAPRVRRLLSAQCTEERYWGCAGLGLLLETGMGGARDVGSALSAYLRGCDSGDPSACVFGGVLIEENSAVHDHRRRARALFETGCAAPVGEPCWVEVASPALWSAHFRGEALERRSCGGFEARALACYNAALGYERGVGGAVDGQRAQELLDESCAQGFEHACRRASAHVLH